ncbi:MAG: toll/interleukin-1 receptor domain-containing protein, partial [Candidatus Hodarchaeota archaeon]
MSHEVFISYASEDKSIADEIRWHLEENEIGCWIAPRDIKPGMEYAEAIVDAIDKSKAMVLVFSAHANRSPQVRREVERAVSKDIHIIPFRIENVSPTNSMEYYISSPHWLNAFPPPLSEHLEKLLDAVRNLLQKKRIPEEVPRREIEMVKRLPSVQEKEFHRRQLIKAANLYKLGE